MKEKPLHCLHEGLIKISNVHCNEKLFHRYYEVSNFNTRLLVTYDIIFECFVKYWIFNCKNINFLSCIVSTTGQWFNWKMNNAIYNSVKYILVNIREGIVLDLHCFINVYSNQKISYW